jgi:hypothetical protein
LCLKLDYCILYTFFIQSSQNEHIQVDCVYLSTNPHVAYFKVVNCLNLELGVHTRNFWVRSRVALVLCENQILLYKYFKNS